MHDPPPCVGVNSADPPQTELSSKSACRVLFFSNGLSLQVLFRFCKDFHPPRLTEGFASLHFFNVQRLKI